MSGDPSAILTQPGFLVWAPTDLTAAFPHGGTSLGFTEDGGSLLFSEEWKELMGDEFGPEVLDTHYTGAKSQFSVILKQWNDTSVQRAFPGGLTATGSSSGTKLAQYPGTLAHGTRGRSVAGKLAFIPNDVTVNKVFLAMLAQPQLKDSGPIRWTNRQETRLQLIFHLLRDDSISSGSAAYPYRTWAIGDIDDLVIP